MAKQRGVSLRFQPAGGTAARTVPCGKKQILKIERLSHDGRGIGHVGNSTWLVAGALPGEEVEAKVLAARSQLVEARLTKVLTASAERREPPCALAGRCGGCSVQHMPHSAQLALKQRSLEEQLARANLQVEQWAAPLQATELGYRRRARLAVRFDVKSRHLAIGFREAFSQQIVDVPQCPVLRAELSALLTPLAALLRRFAKPQRIGHIELFSGSAVALLMRHTAELEEGDQALLRSFCTEHQVQLWWQGAGEPYSDIAHTELAYRLEAEKLTIACQPGDFVQVNAAINEQMIAQALDWLALEPGMRVLDLFCGLGNFALPLAKRAAQVVAVEGVPAMLERGARTAQANGIHNISWHCSDLTQPMTQAAWLQGEFAAALLDPPRDGAAQAVQSLAQLNIPRLVYVSCNPATLVRDAALLQTRGYRLRRAGILDMFAQTAHVEAMVLFERA